MRFEKEGRREGREDNIWERRRKGIEKREEKGDDWTRKIFCSGENKEKGKENRKRGKNSKS